MNPKVGDVYSLKGTDINEYLNTDVICVYIIGISIEYVAVHHFKRYVDKLIKAEEIDDLYVNNIELFNDHYTLKMTNGNLVNTPEKDKE